MNISGIRPEAGFYDFNSIKFRPGVDKDAIAGIVEDKPSTGFSEQSAVADISEEGIAKAREKQTFGAYDFAAQYKPGVTFDLKGSESDIKSLDVERAVSDMKKDSILHQYQFFVGDHASLADGSASLRGAEDFTL